jgi:hypothetical protein
VPEGHLSSVQAGECAYRHDAGVCGAIAVTWLWFRKRELPLSCYCQVGLAWTVIAVVCDYFFIVMLFPPVLYRLAEHYFKCI